MPEFHPIHHMARSGGTVVAKCLAAIVRANEENGGSLVIRDWTHLDFTGVPFWRPTCRLKTYDALNAIPPTRHTCTVRHPVAQWRSLQRIQLGREGGLSPSDFFEGYWRFAHQVVEIGFIRYEDFTNDPDRELERLCTMLGVPYDPGYRAGLR